MRMAGLNVSLLLGRSLAPAQRDAFVAEFERPGGSTYDEHPSDSSFRWFTKNRQAYVALFPRRIEIATGPVGWSTAPLRTRYVKDPFDEFMQMTAREHVRVAAVDVRVLMTSDEGACPFPMPAGVPKRANSHLGWSWKHGTKIHSFDVEWVRAHRHVVYTTSDDGPAPADISRLVTTHVARCQRLACAFDAGRLADA